MVLIVCAATWNLEAILNDMNNTVIKNYFVKQRIKMMQNDNIQQANTKSGIFYGNNKKERSSPGLRTWSPTVLLAWPEHA